MSARSAFGRPFDPFALRLWFFAPMERKGMEMTADQAYDALCAHHETCWDCEHARGDASYMCPEGAELFRQWIRVEYREGQALAGEFDLH
jgi:hypothetical protein